MAVDYRKLCLKLFDTDDVEELKKISENLKRKNSRNAGRKAKFTNDEIAKIKSELSNGATVNMLAKRYNTSRQIITKNINTPPGRDYSLRIQYLYKNKVCTQIDVDFIHEKIKIENRTDDILHRAFGVKENPTWSDFECFLEERCFPRTRCGAKEILNDLNLTSYDPLQIAEKTKGKMADDGMYMKFKYYEKGAYNENI